MSRDTAARGEKPPIEQRTVPHSRKSLEEFQRWEERFGVPEYVFGKAPNGFLKSCVSLLPAAGKALAIADGEGRNGVWLAEQGLDVVSIEFSPAAQRKAIALAKERGVTVAFEQADVHTWLYPEATFDLVADIFTQFSSPAQRVAKWRGVRRTLKPGGLLILQGYTPKQLQYGTGGPKEVDQLYTRGMLEEAFRGFRDMTIVEEEVEMREGAAHSGISAVINLTAWK
jgi:SAM-dependent methyltransferase